MSKQRFLLLTFVLVCSTATLTSFDGPVQSNEPENTLLTDVEACTDQQLESWQFVSNSTLGVAGRDPVGHQIGSIDAKRNAVLSLIPLGKNWYPPDGFKHTLCGTLYSFGYHDTWESGDEADWNSYIIPNPEFTFLINDLLFLMSRIKINGTWYGVWHDCRGKEDCLEAEITPDEGFYQNPWFNKSTGKSSLIGKQLCTYGPWVYEEAHSNKPEIHPSELYWWRDTTNGPYYLLLLQDDSNRFDRADNYSPEGGPPWWHPWSENPRTGEFKLAFEVDPNGDPLIYDIRSLYERFIVTPRDTVASRDSDDGNLHALEYNDKRLVFVNERQTADEHLGVSFDDTCLNANSNRLQGYIRMTAKIGEGDRGKEGYYALQVDQRQEAVTRKNVRVIVETVKQYPIPNRLARPDSIVIKANGLERSVPLPGDLRYRTINVNAALDFGDVFPFEYLTVTAEARRRGGIMDTDANTFWEEDNFGAGPIRTLKLTRFMCDDPEPGCKERLVTLAEVTYRISIEELLDLPLPPALPKPSSEVLTSLEVSLVEDSLRSSEINGKRQLVVDLELQTAGSTGVKKSDFTISSVELQSEGESRSLLFDTNNLLNSETEEHVTLRSVPIPLNSTSQLKISMESGKELTKPVPSLGLQPIITSQAAIATSEPSTQKNNRTKASRWQYDVMFVYSVMRDGQVALEDDAPVPEILNELLAEGQQTADKEKLVNLFGSEQPLKVEWSFNARNITTGEPVTVKVGGVAQPKDILVNLLSDISREGHIEIIFPENNEDNLLELTTTVKVTDTFGLVGETQFQTWSHVEIIGDSEAKIINELAKRLSYPAQLLNNNINIEPQVFLPTDIINSSQEAKVRRSLLLRQLTLKAVQDKIITIEEYKDLAIAKRSIQPLSGRP